VATVARRPAVWTVISCFAPRSGESPFAKFARQPDGADGAGVGDETASATNAIAAQPAIGRITLDDMRALSIGAALFLVACSGAASAPPPPFSSSVSTVTRGALGGSYRDGCPVGSAQLRVIRLRYWGFDGQAHTGAIVVSRAVVRAVVTVFAQLYRARFPIHRLQPIAAFGGSDDRSMAADNTSGFNCRYAVASGPKRWSSHAYGEAIDVNPVENPYIEGGVVRPRAGAVYVNRKRVRPGMAVAGGTLVDAFASVGWKWGGRWSATPDYQHFAATGG
jgi:hypothetical protein